MKVTLYLPPEQWMTTDDKVIDTADFRQWIRQLITTPSDQPFALSILVDAQLNGPTLVIDVPESIGGLQAQQQLRTQYERAYKQYVPILDRELDEVRVRVSL